MKKLYKNEDLFLTFIIKEKELAEIKKQNAQLMLKYLSLKFINDNKNISFVKKIFLNISDTLNYIKMKRIENKNYKKIKYLPDDDKIDKIISSKIYKQSEFKIYFINLRKFQQKKIIRNGGTADVSNIEYEVFLRIEFNDLISSRHLKKTFINIEDAQEYFYLLIHDNKNKKVHKLINELTDIMDKKIKNLKELNNITK